MQVLLDQLDTILLIRTPSIKKPGIKYECNQADEENSSCTLKLGYTLQGCNLNNLTVNDFLFHPSFVRPHETGV